VIPKKRRAAENRAARRQGSSHHQLNSFWAVAEEGSFSKAAQRLLRVSRAQDALVYLSESTPSRRGLALPAAGGDA
jgi:hypothetical protein